MAQQSVAVIKTKHGSSFVRKKIAPSPFSVDRPTEAHVRAEAEKTRTQWLRQIFQRDPQPENFSEQKLTGLAVSCKGKTAMNFRAVE